MLAWYKTGDVSWIGAIPRESIIVFDTETTGTKADVDEIIQLSVLDGNGRVLFSSYIKPERATSWPEAEAVNGIAPETVANAPRFADVATQVNAVFSQAQLLVAYNIGFDAKFLHRAGIALPPCRQFDVMQEFAPIAGRWNEGFQDYAWVKLEECAAHYQCAFGAHDALEDARATLHCFWSMLQDDASGGYLELVGKHRPQQPASHGTAQTPPSQQSAPAYGNAARPRTGTAGLPTNRVRTAVSAHSRPARCVHTGRSQAGQQSGVRAPRLLLGRVRHPQLLCGQGGARRGIPAVLLDAHPFDRSVRASHRRHLQDERPIRQNRHLTPTQ